jgi:hypothetical protein
MADIGGINITINTDEKFSIFLSLLEDVNELSELIPDWQAVERDKIIQSILVKAKDLIDAKSKYLPGGTV